MRKVVASVLIVLSAECMSQDLENSLLWQIEGNGIQSSYLFGTFHILPQSAFELGEPVVKAFHSCDLVVLELDVDDPTLQVQLLGLVAMNGGKRLDDLLKPEDLQKLDSLLDLNPGTGIEPFMNWKPMMLTSLILTHFIEGQPASFETVLAQMATQTGKEVIGLELVAEQLALFDTIPYENQVDGLLDMIYKEEESRELFNQMIRTYQAEDIDQMYRMIIEYFGDKTQVELLVTKRNRRWISRIAELSAGQSAFYGVGAGHLGGSEGLINLLRREGYQVSPVN